MTDYPNLRALATAFGEGRYLTLSPDSVMMSKALLAALDIIEGYGGGIDWAAAEDYTRLAALEKVADDG